MLVQQLSNTTQGHLPRSVPPPAGPTTELLTKKCPKTCPQVRSLIEIHSSQVTPTWVKLTKINQHSNQEERRDAVLLSGVFGTHWGILHFALGILVTHYLELALPLPSPAFKLSVFLNWVSSQQITEWFFKPLRFG